MKTRRIGVALLGSTLAAALQASGAAADERHLPAELLRAMGYRPFEATLSALMKRPPRADLPRNLPWPVRFQDDSHSIAQNYVEFQDYGDGPYFHGGCDLRAEAGSDVKAPVSGTLEGGYYSYSNNPDGSDQKFWQPWSGDQHEDPYFELAIVTDDGYRFELHHVDVMALPDQTIRWLNQGHARVQAGVVLGKVLTWPDGDYNHIHFNIIRSDGVRLNPEWYSETVSAPDHVAPTIHGVYGIQPDGSAIAIAPGARVEARLSELVVAATDTRATEAYVQTPPLVQLQFDGASATGWDFRHTLTGPDGRWPDIREVFARSVSAGGQSYENSGQYGAGMFLVRLKLDGSRRGHFTVRVGDTAGNTATFEATLGQ